MFRFTKEEITNIENNVNDFEPDNSEEKHIINCIINAGSRNIANEKTYEVTITIGMFPGE